MQADTIKFTIYEIIKFYSLGYHTQCNFKATNMMLHVNMSRAIYFMFMLMISEKKKIFTYIQFLEHVNVLNPE